MSAVTLDAPSTGVVDPAATSTSSFNWWPYPPQGVTTSPTSVPTSVATTPTTPSTIDSSTDSDSLASASATVDTSTESSTLSIISFTASVPGPSADATYPPEISSKVHKGLNPIYLTPLFVIAGAVLGALLANWLFNRRMKRRENGRTVEFTSLRNSREDKHQFSRFVNESDDEKDDHFEAKHLQALLPSEEERDDDDEHDLGDGPGTPNSMAPFVHQSAPRSGSWLQRAISKASARPIKAPGQSRNHLSAIKDKRGAGAARTPVTPSQMTKYQLSDSPIPNSPHILPTTVQSPGFSDEEYDNVPIDSLHHKSIRRGIRERIQFGSTRVSKHRDRAEKGKLLRTETQKSTTSFAETDARDKEGMDKGTAQRDREESDNRGVGLARTRAGASRTSQAGKDNSRGHGRAISDVTIQGTPADLKPVPKAMTNFTEKPVRRQSSLRRLEEGTSKPVRVGLDGLKDKFSRDEPKEATSSIPFASSPPTVWSPSLDSELMFSPTSSPLSRPGRFPTRTDSTAARSSSPAKHHNSAPASTGPNRLQLPVTRTRTLQGPRSPPPRKGTIKIGARSPGSPAQRYYARREANKKVEGILSHSYSSRRDSVTGKP